MNVLQAGASRFSPFFLFGRLVFLVLHGDLPIDLCGRLTGDATFLIGGGSDAIAVGRLGRDQPALLEQFVHQFSHKLVPDLIALVFVTQTKNCKVFRNMDRNGVYNVKIAALCPAFFQDIICDLIPLGLQFRPIRFIAQIPVFLVAVLLVFGGCITASIVSKGNRPPQLLEQAAACLRF